LLLVDASQGVQAQSLSVFHVAKERGLKIVPVLNKVLVILIEWRLSLTSSRQIDLPAAQPERIAAQIESTFGIDMSEVLYVSAKTGQGVEAVLRAIVERIPPPVGNVTDPLKALLFDSS
jgi:translation factor GUF1, mitochondrial